MAEGRDRVVGLHTAFDRSRNLAQSLARAADEIASGSFDPSDAVEFWDLVNRQDWTVCEAVQDPVGG